jgi:hypothetical protein
MYVLPTIGTQFYIFQDGCWQTLYKESLSEEEVAKIRSILEKALDDLNIKPEKTW